MSTIFKVVMFAVIFSGFYMNNLAHADTVTVVLQNGLDDYDGCIDAAIEQNVTTPTGENAKLTLYYG